jgi:hypothetical protein
MQEIKLDGWVAEDKNGKQYFYREKPIKSRNRSFMCIGPVMELQSRLDLGTDWAQSLHQVIDNKVQEPRPELKIDDPVLVRDNDCEAWVRGHFAGWKDNGECTTFWDGRTSFTVEGRGIETWSLYKLTFKYWANRQAQEIIDNDR